MGIKDKAANGIFVKNIYICRTYILHNIYRQNFLTFLYKKQQGYRTYKFINVNENIYMYNCIYLKYLKQLYLKILMLQKLVHICVSCYTFIFVRRQFTILSIILVKEILWPIRKYKCYLLAVQKEETGFASSVLLLHPLLCFPFNTILFYAFF